MKILIVHNYYMQRGGEDAVVEAEKKLLTAKGHQVIEFSRTNQPVRGLALMGAALSAIWSRSSARAVKNIIEKFHPDIVHVHNTFALISPSVYHVCKRARVPVVQTLHNYRLLCPAATLFRNGRTCEDCLGHTPPWYGIIHGCWQGKRHGTAVIVIMLTIHRWLKTWYKYIDCYIALTPFSKQKFVRGGLQADSIVIKPNLIDERGILSPVSSEKTGGKYALFVGRLSPEKGLDILLDAWQKVPGVRLKLAGDGPLAASVAVKIKALKLDQVIQLGKQNRDETNALIRSAQFLIIPSLCYENFPLVILEACQYGVAVIASRLGVMEDIVKEGQTGLLFPPGDSDALAESVRWAWDHPGKMLAMGNAARREYEQKYAAERNYKILMEIYLKAIGKMQGHS